ncbi:DUF2147 domain-containing protein [Sphingomonas sp. 37zxx]|uniref:DUF2147 domain-containing protein n=1 Tax=Sphingomonas sp. 37zxx TaxID=1550073 RepID=UPI00068D7F63|nr:DUF2147 domain-containing protein [Sphingomonas sp. 37zxx]
MLGRLSTIAALILAATPAAAQTAPDWSGVWRNATNSVHIRAQRCGRAMCGTVIWANAKAKADVARASDDPLVGTQLFRNFEYREGTWYGEVFVPDLGRAFEGTVELADRNTLVGTGCLFGNFGCRAQRWIRVK